jgi:hypothetical protein
MQANLDYLWKFGGPRKRFIEGTSNNLKGSSGAPMLVPSYTNVHASVKEGDKPLGAMQGNTTRIREIDVVNEFEWTTSPQSARHDVPTIRLREMYVKANPMINQIARNIAIIGEGLADMSSGKGISDVMQSISDSSKYVSSLGEKIEGMASSAGGAIRDSKGAIVKEDGKGNALNTPVTVVKDTIATGVKTAGVMTNTGLKIGSQMMDLAAKQGVGDPLNPYRLMYVTELSGFQYILPYFNSQHKTLSNNWGGSPEEQTFGEKMIHDTVGKITETIGNVMQIRNVFEPGKYTEKPQFYTGFGEQKRSYTVTFPLANTNSYTEVLRNWQLVYLLVYQNSQNRISRTLVAPPVIYEAEIPGVWYSPYAYISNLDVQYVGARRKMTIEVPRAPATAMSSERDNTPVSLETIIPDIYQVTLTVNDLHAESQNFLHHLVRQKDRVSTSDLTPGASGGVLDVNMMNNN